MKNPTCDNLRPPRLSIGDRAWCTHKNNIDFLGGKCDPEFVRIIDAIERQIDGKNQWLYLVLRADCPEWLHERYFWSDEQLANIELACQIN